LAFDTHDPLECWNLRGFMRAFIAALAAAVAALAAAVAAAQSTFTTAAPSPPITHFTVENVSEAVRELGATNVSTARHESVSFVNFDYNGLPFSYSIRICDAAPELGPGCVGLLMAIGIDLSDQPRPLELVNSFNRSFPMVTAVIFDDKKLALGRFMFSVGGLSKDNLKANIALFAAAPAIFAKHVQSQLVASAESGPARFTRVSAGLSLRPVHLAPQEINRYVDEKALRLRRP
jgi:hypothetical protein